MGMQRSLFLLGLSLVVALGAVWGWVVVGLDSITWKLALSIPAGLVLFWPIAQHIANSSLLSLGTRRECVIEFILKFLAKTIIGVSAVTGVGALLLAGFWAIARRGSAAKETALFGVQSLGVTLAALLVAVAFHYLFRFLLKKLGAVQLDILYLAGAGATVLAGGGIIAAQTWIGVLDESVVSQRIANSAWIAVVGVGYAWVQILAATPKEKKVAVPDALMTALVVICGAVLFWAIGKASFPVAIGLLAWVGAIVLDKEQKKRKF
ncbi:hypothetical protein Oscil6304_2259 [Oscillatoria acuminata PCC 6304]|uniref:Uncharacterized protein n=2 Tax=Oscillatoria acuminata TaxID=118323 RepID=K9THM4_9CYAN|nr:hypothetical protein Oscil6304_2259 [Oscillatoria acuminata PCC 6304]